MAKDAAPASKSSSSPATGSNRHAEIKVWYTPAKYAKAAVMVLREMKREQDKKK